MDMEIVRVFRKRSGEIHFQRLETGIRGAQTKCHAEVSGKVNNQESKSMGT